MEDLGGAPQAIFTGRNEVVAKVMFLQVCVCPQGGRVSASVHAGMPDPPDQADPPGTGRHPPGPGRHPPDQADTPGPGRPPTPPRNRQTPPQEEDSSIRSTSGRYASYWNAFLFLDFIVLFQKNLNHPSGGEILDLPL